MDRRHFLKQAATATTLPIMLGGFPIHALTRNATLDALAGVNDQNDRVLVLIQLNGGNDGLNTVIPLDQYSPLSAARSEVLIPQQQVLSLTTETGLHPSMSGLHNLYQNGKVSIVQSVGYPDPNFSHFRSLDIWTTASPADTVYETGWLGRYLEAEHPTYPVGYPNEDYPDPLAITIGSIVSNTCQGSTSSLGMAIKNPEEFTQLLTGNTGSVPNNRYGFELNFLRQTMLQTNLYIQTIQDAAGAGNNLSSLYPTPGQNKLADQLKIVANLISGGLKTKVYIVNIGGFDTHANQVDQNNPLLGRHAELLDELSVAISAFQDDIRLLGHEDRVLGMTFSEFGRRIRSNASYGTDHGAAAPLILFGTKVNNQIIGANPIIPPGADPKASIPMQFDFRSVYGSVLMDWFCIGESIVKQLLFEGFQHVQCLSSTCTTSTGIRDDALALNLSQNYPNPAANSTIIAFKSEGGDVSLTLFDTRGSKLRTLTNQFFAPGSYKISVDTSELSNGIYYYRMQHKNLQTMKMMTVMHP